MRDIESAYEVKEYVRMYLGDSKQSVDFAKQFLEKRSKWRSAQRPQVQADDLCKPAPAVNPNACTEFQEVKVNPFLHHYTEKNRICQSYNRSL